VEASVRFALGCHAEECTPDRWDVQLDCHALYN
jgi:hypothetical protein